MRHGIHFVILAGLGYMAVLVSRMILTVYRLPF
jgi:hypothetical protein